MRHSINGLIFLFSFLLASCGPSKELISSRTKTDSLEMVVSHLNNTVAQLHAELNSQQQQIKDLQSSNDVQVSKMKNQYAIAMQEATDCKLAKEAVARRMEEF